MERMLCAQCAAPSYSAAAKAMVDRGERCPRCGGALTLAAPEPVGAAERDD
jgi:ribosomal protein S27AE